MMSCEHMVKKICQMPKGSKMLVGGSHHPSLHQYNGQTHATEEELERTAS